MLDMNKIGLPITNLPSSWCIYANRERVASTCPHFIINTNTPGVNGVSGCENTRNIVYDGKKYRIK